MPRDAASVLGRGRHYLKGAHTCCPAPSQDQPELPGEMSHSHATFLQAQLGSSLSQSAGFPGPSSTSTHIPCAPQTQRPGAGDGGRFKGGESCPSCIMGKVYLSSHSGTELAGRGLLILPEDQGGPREGLTCPEPPALQHSSEAELELEVQMPGF